MTTDMEQALCDRCRSSLQPGAAYCDDCGERTHKARRIVGLAIRVELVFIALVVVLVFGFAAIYFKQ